MITTSASGTAGKDRVPGAFPFRGIIVRIGITVLSGASRDGRLGGRRRRSQVAILRIGQGDGRDSLRHIDGGAGGVLKQQERRPSPIDMGIDSRESHG